MDIFREFFGSLLNRGNGKIFIFCM